ncbi:MAG: hypothetical protein LBL46_02125 [Rickettsiales bacterium]|jgi:glutaredoxin|nr:hypothetical protein [Rickettsiales bacterium]
MKKLLIAGFSAVALVACGEKEVPNTKDITLFYMPGCSHCHNARTFFSTDKALKAVSIEEIDITTPDRKNLARFDAQLKKCGKDSRGVPLVVVKDQCWQGWSPDVGGEIKKALGK